MITIETKKLQDALTEWFRHEHGDSFKAKVKEDVMVFYSYEEEAMYVFKITPVFDEFISDDSHKDIIRRELECCMPEFLMEHDMLGPIVFCEAQFQILSSNRAFLRVCIF